MNAPKISFPFIRMIFFLLFLIPFLIFLFYKGYKAPLNKSIPKLLLIDTTNKTIIFDGTIKKDSGWVQFLVYLEGYGWLKEKSAIVSETKLIDLQKAIAFLDWALWDSLWLSKRPKRKITLSIVGEGEIISESLLIREPNDTILLSDLIFLGSPYFDNLVLREGHLNLCAKCPFYEEEKKLLLNGFRRPSNLSGYYLNTKNFPKVKRVRIKITIKD